MQKTLINICFPNKFKVEYHNETIYVPEESILVKNFYSLISPGTELAFYTGTHSGIKDPNNLWASFPFFPGYASIGIVEEARGKKQSYLGKIMLHFSPHASHNVFQPENTRCFIFDQTIDKKEVLLSRLAQISATAVKIYHKKPSSILILGGGLIGNLCAQLFQINNKNVVLVDILENRLGIAKST